MTEYQLDIQTTYDDPFTYVGMFPTIEKAEEKAAELGYHSYVVTEIGENFKQAAQVRYVEKELEA